jgi:hypothetical protein
MPRYGPVVDVPEWLDVSSDRPCPVCGGVSGCGVLEDGEFARCLNVVCERPVLTGGWLHRLPAEAEKVLTLA